MINNNNYSNVASSPLISIIIPVYNVEPFLKSCLDSVLNQTYSNIEVIIVVSTSQDRSSEICYEYAKKDSRILVMHTEPNGLSDARNKGIAVSKGDYLSFIDSDDRIHQDFITTLYSICAEHDCDIAQCNFYEVFDSQHTPSVTDDNSVNIYSGLEMCYNLYGPIALQSVVAWSKLYKRELFDNISFPFGKIYEDQATSYKLFYNSARVGVTKQKLYYYRQREGSITKQAFSLKNLDYLEALEGRLQFYKEKGERKLYASTFFEYAVSLPTYIYNVRQLKSSNTIEFEKFLLKKYSSVRKEAIRCKDISFIGKTHMILVWLYPRTTVTVNILEKVRKIKSQLN